jgi:hypothetical protein
MIPTAATLYRPNFIYDRDEQRGLEHFRYRTARALSGYFESDFWDSVALRISYFEPSVRHAVLAMSSLYEGFEQAGDFDPGHNGNTRQRQLALLQYNRSIRHTRQMLAKNDHRSPEIALISCVLFVCHELMQYNYYGAIGHVVMGLRIFTPDTSSKINKSLGQLFSRIVMQSMFLGKPHFNALLIPKIVSRVSVPFAGLSDVRDSLEMQFIYVYPLLHAMHKNTSSEADAAEGPKSVIDPTQWRTISANIEEWHEGFQTFVKQHQRQENLSPKESTGIEILKLHYICLTIMLSIAAKPQEPTAVLPDFVSVISIVKSFLHSPNSYLPNYSFDLGIIGPLFYTAAKCPLSTIRWEAVDLLRHRRTPYREGIWGGTMTARMAQRIVELEEEISQETIAKRPRSLHNGVSWSASSEELKFPSWKLARMESQTNVLLNLFRRWRIWIVGYLNYL